MKISARNVIKGRVVSVEKGATTAHVKIEIAAGQRPRPLIVSTRRVVASQVMIGATPPKLVRCGSNTLMQRPTATPASTALPPALRISTPAAVAR